MDFSIDEESRESYDRVGDPISEEIITEETLNDSGAILNTKSNTVANYEMNKTITRKVKPVGIIDSVSVAALINVKYEIDRENGEPVPSEIKGKFKTSPITRDQDEIDKIRELIQAAAGGSIANVVVNEIQFDNVNEQIADLEIAEMVNEQNSWNSSKNVNNYATVIFMLLGFGLMFLLLRSLNNTEGNGIDGILPQAPGQLAASGDPEPAAQFVENATEALEGINPQTNDQAPAQIPGNPTVAAVNYSKTSPEEAAKIIRAWINQS
jgi:flagellar biosynthesis/type III secretory pathway M-ring protein FliF/YscJ